MRLMNNLFNTTWLKVELVRLARNLYNWRSKKEGWKPRVAHIPPQPSTERQNSMAWPDEVFTAFLHPTEPKGAPKSPPQRLKTLTPEALGRTMDVRLPHRAPEWPGAQNAGSGSCSSGQPCLRLSGLSLTLTNSLR